MGFQSIFAWKALPEAAFVKKAVIDAHRSKEESIASGWLHRSARPILPQASPVWKVRNLPHCCLRARESVRRASGFVQIPISLILSYKRGCQGKKLLPAPLRDAGVVTYIQPHLIPHLILRGVIGLVALARRTSPRRCQPQLLVPTRRFHEVSGARRRSVPKLRKLKRWLKCQPRSYLRLEAYSFFRLSEGA
jgi:hypothetical protein